MRTAPHRALSTALLVVCLGGALSLTSCSLTGSGRTDLEWATAKQLAQSSDADRVPTLVAADAEQIRLSAQEVGSGPTVITWKSTSGITRDDCRTGSLDGAPTSSVPGWWPRSTPADSWRCGWWRVFQEDGTYYAWQQRDSQS